MRSPLLRTVILPVQISGPERTLLARLLLDTGATYVTIERATAIDLGFDLDHPEVTTPLVGATGVVQAPLFTATKVKVGDVVASGVRICAQDLPDQARVEIDGLLGMSFLEHTIFTFDFKAKAFTMVDP